MARRTKIVATLGPATDPPGVLDDMVRAGLDLARVNLSHGRSEDNLRRAQAVRDAGRRQGRELGVLADLQGPKIRIEGFREGSVLLDTGAQFRLDATLGGADGDARQVGITYKTLPRDVRPGDTLLLDDGNVVLGVDTVTADTIETTVTVGGTLSDHKGINRLGGGLSAGALTDKDRRDVEVAARMEADYLGVSFPRHAADMDEARRLFRAAGGSGGLVAKMERAEAVEAMDEIIRASDAVMIARGDLGVELGDAELPGLQKRIIGRARQMNGVTITATQMMQSMIENPQPTRAEVLDVANAVLDGTDAVMLSAETAMGRHPAKVIAAMDRICRGAERQQATLVSTHRMDSHFDSTEEAIAMAAMYTANHVDVACILALTESGITPRWMSRISSGIPIYGMTRHVATQRRMTLFRGVYPINFDLDSTDEYRVDRIVVEVLTGIDAAKAGDRIIVTRGDLSGVSGGTNSMKVICVGDRRDDPSPGARDAH